MNMDAIQTQILRRLIEDAQITNAQLARDIGLSESATLERVRRLERKGIIRGFTARVDPAHVGLSVEVYMMVVLTSQRMETVRQFTREMATFDEVMDCAKLLGNFDFMLHVAVPDMEALDHFIKRRLLPTSCIDRIETFTVLETVKRGHPPVVN